MVIQVADAVAMPTTSLTDMNTSPVDAEFTELDGLPRPASAMVSSSTKFNAYISYIDSHAILFCFLWQGGGFMHAEAIHRPCA